MKSLFMSTSLDIWAIVRGTGGTFGILKLTEGGRGADEHAASKAGSIRNTAFADNILTFMILP